MTHKGTQSSPCYVYATIYTYDRAHLLRNTAGYLTAPNRTIVWKTLWLLHTGDKILALTEA